MSIDAKKKELVGTFANKGQEWQPKGCHEEANVYDFIDKELGKVTPYGIDDLLHNQGWVSVGIGASGISSSVVHMPGMRTNFCL